MIPTTTDAVNLTLWALAPEGWQPVFTRWAVLRSDLDAVKHNDRFLLQALKKNSDARWRISSIREPVLYDTSSSPGIAGEP